LFWECLHPRALLHTEEAELAASADSIDSSIKSTSQ
jgi:hypothetical protein